MKDPVVVSKRALLRAIKQLEQWEESSINGGDPVNMDDARHARQSIVDLKAAIQQAEKK